MLAYGGQCVDKDGNCTNNLRVYPENISAQINNLACKKIEANCYVSFNIPEFELERDGSITLELFESESFCSGINFKAQTSSSIPGEYSSNLTRIPIDKNGYFKGQDPTIINLLMTPSLFISNMVIWKEDSKDHKGYHISQTEDVIKGSQMSYSE